MKVGVGACATLLILLAGCSQQSADIGSMAAGSARKSSASLETVRMSRQPAQSIANAPDRGALVSYQNQGKPAKREGAFTYYPVAISEAHALKGVVNGQMTVPTPEGGQVKLRYERHEESPDGNWTWIGRVEGGDPNQEAIITFGEKAVFASIPQTNGQTFNIETRNGALFAVQVDRSKLKSGNTGHSDTAIPAALAVRKAAAAQVQAQAQTAQAAVAASAPATSTNTIDLALGYTAGFRATYGSQSAAVTRLNYLVQVGNQALSNSIVNGYLRIVTTTEVNYTDTTTNQSALQELTGNTGTSPVTVPASLVPLRTARDQYGADLALLVRDFRQPENEGCGIAWLLGANQNAIDPATDASWGYGVISDGDDLGTDGNSYYCVYETLVHETAHLMGSAHDAANATASGRYPYSYGYKTATGNFYTVMAYGDEGQTLYRTFSNPNITICGNNACGVANTADNARSLNQTIPVVAQFRATVVPFGRAVKDFDGDGRSDVLWRNTAGNNTIWKSANSATAQYVTSVGTAWQIVGLGDFDGDGKSDILWRSGSSNTIWRSANATTKLGVTSVGTHWSVAGVGDFDGDGRSDILWRSGSANVIWRSGSSATQQTVASMSSSWTVVGIGDFDSNGQSDILWRNNTTGGNVIWKGASATNRTFPASVGTHWRVVGIADFDGDGNDDILWRNTTGGNAIWRSGNAATLQWVSTVGTHWQVAGVGDYDGDGLADIHWRSGTQNVIWKGANATNQLAMSAQPTIWTAQPPSQ